MKVDKDQNSPRRKSTRLKGYDYSTPGAYFITICTRDRMRLLSEIVKADLTETCQANNLAVGPIISTKKQFHKRHPGIQAKKANNTEYALSSEAVSSYPSFKDSITRTKQKGKQIEQIEYYFLPESITFTTIPKRTCNTMTASGI